MPEPIKFKKQNALDGYYMTTNGDTLLCSCGRALEKLCEGVWRCPGGYPTYQVDEGDILIDKFGNVMIKDKPHNQNQKAVSEGLAQVQKIEADS